MRILTRMVSGLPFRRTVTACAVLAAAWAVAPALADDEPRGSKGAPDLAWAEEDAEDRGQQLRVIFSYAADADLSAIGRGFPGVTIYPHIRVCSVDIPADRIDAGLRQLFDESGVHYVVPNRKLRHDHDGVNKGARGRRFGAQVGARTGEPAPSHVRGTTGAAQLAEQGGGVTVAVIDSGIAEHPDFANDGGRGSRIVAHVDFTREESEGGSRNRYDRYGHGTHVAGLIGGNGSATPAAAGRALAGVAPQVRLVDLRVLRADGTGDLDALFAALEWVAANRVAYDVRVVNLSLGTAPFESFDRDPLCQAVERLVELGVTVVVAAGNDGKDAAGNIVYGGINSPANDPKVITVGASNTKETDARGDDVVTTYSSRGPTRSYRCRALAADGSCPAEQRLYDDLVKPDVVAPGNRLVSTLAEGSRLAADNPELVRFERYFEMSGTSMAAPVVSGIVAALLQARPDLAPGAVKAVLMYTAQPLAGAGFEDQGTGEVNAALAAQLASAFAPHAAALPAGSDAAPGFDLRAPLVATIGGEAAAAGRGVIYSGGFLFLDRVKRADGYRSGTPAAPGVPWDGEILSGGVQWADGAAVDGDGLLWADGILWSGAAARTSAPRAVDGTLWSDGIVWSDSQVGATGILWSGARLTSNGLLWGNGILWSDGTLAPGGEVVPDGILWSGRRLVGSGVAWGDGLLWADGILWSGARLRGE